MTKFIALSGIAGTLVFAGCGKKENAGSTAASKPAAAASAEKPAAAQKPAAAEAAVFQIGANDQMKFTETRLEVKAGAPVRVVLTNSGTLPKIAMGHNWILLKKGVDVMAYTTAAMTAQATEYVPAARAADVIAHTRLIGPKEKAEVSFTAPAEAGEYVYLCTFPGHYAAGMHGVLVVK